MSRAPRYRVYVDTRRVPAGRGYVGFDTVTTQTLQVKRWYGWADLDQEVVPQHALISAGATGDAGWYSKFTKLGSFGRGGVFTPHPGMEGHLA